MSRPVTLRCSATRSPLCGRRACPRGARGVVLPLSSLVTSTLCASVSSSVVNIVIMLPILRGAGLER